MSTHFLLACLYPFLPSTFWFSGTCQYFWRPKSRAVFPTCFACQKHLLKIPPDFPETIDWRTSRQFPESSPARMTPCFCHRCCLIGLLFHPVHGRFGCPNCRCLTDWSLWVEQSELCFWKRETNFKKTHIKTKNNTYLVVCGGTTLEPYSSSIRIGSAELMFTVVVPLTLNELFPANMLAFHESWAACA